VKKISTVRTLEKEIFEEQKLTIGMDLGDRWSFYCILDETGKIILKQKVPTTPEAMQQTFSRIPQRRIALETGTHSPWVSRLLTELGYEVIVAHAQKVQLITKSNRKDDRHDARTLARLARIDPELLGPVQHRSAQAQIHLTVIRASAELVRARTALVNAARGLVKSYGERLPKCSAQQVNRELGAALRVIHGKKKMKVRLDINRPSHGRTYLFFWSVSPRSAIEKQAHTRREKILRNLHTRCSQARRESLLS
jgi:transposase